MSAKKLLTVVLALAMMLTCVGMVSADAEFSYPMAFEGTLDYWLPLNSNVAASEATLNETPYAQYLYEATGIKVNYIHPTSGSESEGFALMLAGGDMPDIVEVDWNSASYYPSGLDTAISNGLVLDLNEYKDMMPNYLSVLEGNETWYKMAKTDKGSLPGFWFIRGDPYLQVYGGMIVRKDWLDKLGMEVPTTIDEWTEMLTRFRDELGATSPLIATGAVPDMLSVDAFCGAFGVSNGFYINDEGKVAYGRMEEGWKKTLELLAGWYADGLLNPDFITDTGDVKNSKVLTGEGGAFYGLTGSGIGVYMNSAAAAGNEEFQLIGVPYPTIEEGATPEFGQYENPVPNVIATISPSSENIEAAVRLLDFGYSEVGHNMFNFGKEGESFNIVDGVPTFTDMVLKPEGGISIGQGIARVARSSYGGPFVQDINYMLQYLQLDCQKEAVSNWSATNIAAHKMPNVSVSEEDSKEFNNIISEINTFVQEYTPLAITGENDLGAFEDEYVSVLKDIGIERAIEIYQKAYDNFNNR